MLFVHLQACFGAYLRLIYVAIWVFSSIRLCRMASRLDQKSVREGTIQAHKNETNFSGNLLSRQHSMPFNILKGQNKYQICGYQDKQPLFGLWFRLDVLLSGWKGVWESERDCQICVCVDIYVAMVSIFRIGGTYIYVMALFFSLFHSFILTKNLFM